MMVNDFKNNIAPWQSTVPQQMPWMTSYEPPTSNTMQFGQQSISGINSNVMAQNSIDPRLIIQSQHPSMISFPTATTLTLPVTVCPTSSAANTLLTPGMSMPQNGVTTTTQSCPLIQNIPSTISTFIPNYNLLTQNVSPPVSQNTGGYSHGSLLTHLPSLTALPTDKIFHHKRRSFEMEEDQIKVDEPPTKQLLSERKLFKQFGSLHLDGSIDVLNTDINDGGDSDDSEEGERSQSVSNNNNYTQEREELDRYVYLLFKDKNSDATPFAQSNTTLDRLAREERDKLSKAVILWNPPIKNNFFGNEADDEEEEDEEELKYSDHTDFLKKSITTDDPIIITEVTYDQPNSNIPLHGNNEQSYSDTDYFMLE